MAEHDSGSRGLHALRTTIQSSMTALRRTADAQASLQKQFDRHKCEPDVLLREEPDDEEDEEEDDDRKEEDGDDDEDHGYSE
jgi:hypothetical protein